MGQCYRLEPGALGPSILTACATWNNHAPLSKVPHLPQRASQLSAQKNTHQAWPQASCCTCREQFLASQTSLECYNYQNRVSLSLNPILECLGSSSRFLHFPNEHPGRQQVAAQVIGLICPTRGLDRIPGFELLPGTALTSASQVI